jgi:hypothetical protein
MMFCGGDQRRVTAAARRRSLRSGPLDSAPDDPTLDPRRGWLELVFALRNQDRDSAFAVSTWLFQRVRLEVRDGAGEFVPRKPRPAM